jgi:hypothetical protein
MLIIACVRENHTGRVAMVEAAWVSNAMSDPELHKSLESDLAKSDEVAFIRGLKLLGDGQPVPSKLCPKRMWREKGLTAIKKLPYLFNAQGYYVVSQKAADIILKHDLGSGPIDVRVAI